MFRLLRDLKLNIKISILGAGSVLITAAALVALAVWQSGQYNEVAQREVDRLLDADLNHVTQGPTTWSGRRMRPSGSNSQRTSMSCGIYLPTGAV
jgi:hypothetical protein